MDQPPIWRRSQDFDRRAGNIVKHANLAHTEPVLRLGDTWQPLDTTAARLRWLVPQMPFERRSNTGPSIRLQQLEVFDGFGGKDNLESHVGQGITKPESRQTGFKRMRRRRSCGVSS